MGALWLLRVQPRCGPTQEPTEPPAATPYSAQPGAPPPYMEKHYEIPLRGRLRQTAESLGTRQ